jgi:site-specific DNA-methyltransferase (adenine-specific)
LFTQYVNNLATYLDGTRKVLKPEGTLWVNLGDTYYGSNKGSGGHGALQETVRGSHYKYNKGVRGSRIEDSDKFKMNELPRKSLCMIPARFAIEMQNRGWVLRNQVIWHKPNAVPNPVEDRFLVDYEVVYVFSMSPKYSFNMQLEPYQTELNRWGGDELKADGESSWDTETGQSSYRKRNLRPNPLGRRMRSVWSINTESKRGLSHVATYPEGLVITPILAGSNEGDIILDPFFGAGTTAVVAEKLKRRWIGIELVEEYCKEGMARILKERNNGS